MLKIGEFARLAQVSPRTLRHYASLGLLAPAITEQSVRLERVAALLEGMEKGIGMRSIDVTLRTAEPIRMAATDGVAPGYGHDNLGPVFDARLPVVWEHLLACNVQPGISVAYFEWPDDDGRIVAHIGFDIGDQIVADTDEVRVVELPPVQVAYVLHRGPMAGFTDTFLAVVHWIDTNGYEIAERSRELYHKWTPSDPDATIVELQIPVRHQ